MTNKCYQNLRVWKNADDLAFKIYKMTETWPKVEQYGLTSQIRRSSLSVVLNIVEGTGRQGRNDTKRFIEISLGSLREADYLLDFAKRLNYLTQEKFQALELLADTTGAQLWKFYQSLKF